MRVDVESYGNTRRDFYDLRSDLIEQDKKFDETSLSLLPYHQLHLAAMGNAGAAACQVTVVQQEKARRRERFIAMDETEFKASERYLRAEEMYDDVIRVIGSKLAPRWEELSDPQKLWAKLSCLYNHLDDPQQRMGEALLLLRKCSTISHLPTDVCQHYMGRLRGLMATYPGKVTDAFFRAQIEDTRDNIRDFLTDDERGACDKEQIADYQCSSDCFRIFIP
jgi:hypothetical protein